MIKEIRYAGYATEPSDYECADGQLAASLNLISEEGQLKPLFQPKEQLALTGGSTVMFLHQTAGYTHHIVHDPTGNTLGWLHGNTEDMMTTIHAFGSAAIHGINAIGNTIIALASDGIHYILWRETQYAYLGQKPPSLDIAFGLRSDIQCWPKDINKGEGTTAHADRAELRGMVNKADAPLPFVSETKAWVRPRGEWTPGDDFEEAYDYSLEYATGSNGDGGVAALVGRLTNFALGQINRLVSEHATQKGRFVHPFFVRWAYELYDGSLIMHSDPVLLIPNSRAPFFAMDGDHGFELEDAGNKNVNYRFRGRAYAFVAALTARVGAVADVIDTLRTGWKDIIKGINIYVSAPLYTYHQAGKVWGWTNMDGNWDGYYTEADYGQLGYGHHTLTQLFDAWNEASSPGDPAKRYFLRYSAAHPLPSYILTTPEKTAEEMGKDITTCGTFHKVAHYDLDDPALILMTISDQTVEIGGDTLGTLATRETMKDDYHSHDIITADRSYAYNARINLSGIQRTFHAPGKAACSWPRDDSTTRTWTIAVEIKHQGEASVVVSGQSANGTTLPRYIFYPERNAVKAWLRDSGGRVFRLTLTEHPMLEGAYWFRPIDGETIPDVTTATFPDGSRRQTVTESSKIYTSEVNNPFLFPLTGINTVGTGTIIGICSAAKALSQGQFGEFPLYAFTTDGVWALQVSSTGSYSARQPFTRDVCINPDSITQLDDSVIFATKRGIIRISGSQAQCLTDDIFSEAPFNVLALPCVDQLHTRLGHNADACLAVKPFLGFLAGCRMVYDYVHQHIIVFNPEKDNGVRKYTYAYVYSLKSQRWGMMYSTLSSSINSYPDALAMTHEGKMVSFSDTDEEVCKGLYVTRPLKLGDADPHKTISALIQRGHFQRGDVGTVLYGSRDLYTWYLVWSSKDHYLRGFRGTPYKYFRIAGLATLTDGKSIFGASINFEPRHTNQLR